ncbi:hypothetical protein MJ575_02555 [Klebsiella pneumoniae]|nr:hypothetical protein MJ575_02555 [Klebsiella pneumoniae]
MKIRILLSWSAAFSIAASCNFPIILLSMYWSKLTTRGAMVGNWLGHLLTAVISDDPPAPTIWCDPQPLRKRCSV